MDQYRVNIGSLRQAASPPVLPPLREIWRQPTDADEATFFGVGDKGVFVGRADREDTDGWYTLVRPRVMRLDALEGTPRLELRERRLLGVMADGLVCQGDDAQRDTLVAHDLDGRPRWRVALPGAWDPAGSAAADVFLAWMTDAGRLWRVDAAGGVSELRVPGRILYARASAGRLALSTFDRPGYRGEVRRRADDGVAWAADYEVSVDEDLLPDDRGWVRRTPQWLEARDDDGALLWQVNGARRVWVGGEAVLAADEGTAPDRPGLRLLHRFSGQGAAFSVPRVEDAALRGEMAWLLLGTGALCAVFPDGRISPEMRPPLPLTRLLAWGGRLYGMTGDGAVICWQGSSGSATS